MAENMPKTSFQTYLLVSAEQNVEFFFTIFEM